MIKLVKFLLLIVLIVPTYAWGCITKKTENDCGMKVGCGWNDRDNTCAECAIGHYGRSGKCVPCTNGPNDERTEYVATGTDNGNNNCHWMYSCQTNEQVNCTKSGDTWTCSCEPCIAGGNFEFYYSYVSGSDVTSKQGGCTAGGANTVVLKMTTDSDNYLSFPTGYLFFTPTNTSANLPTNPPATPPTKPSTKASTKASIEIQTTDKFSLGINNDTPYDLEIKDNGYKNYTWSWKDKYNSSKEGDVEKCEVGYWKGNPDCKLFQGDGALDYPFAWESKYRLRPFLYYVQKGEDQINIFTLVTDVNKANSAPSVQAKTLYAFVDNRSNWEKLFDCGNPPDGKCTYELHGGAWQPWPYTHFAIKYGNKSLFLENASTGSYWKINNGFNFNDAFKSENCCVDGEEMPTKVVITDKIEDPEWELTASIPQDGDGVLKIVPPDGYSFTGFLTIPADGIKKCEAGYYCNNCEKEGCPRAFTSAAGASDEQDCYIKPTITFTDISTGGKGGTNKEFGLPACDSTDPDECVGGKIKVYINTSLE